MKSLNYGKFNSFPLENPKFSAGFCVAICPFPFSVSGPSSPSHPSLLMRWQSPFLCFVSPALNYVCAGGKVITKTFVPITPLPPPATPGTQTEANPPPPNEISEVTQCKIQIICANCAKRKSNFYELRKWVANMCHVDKKINRPNALTPSPTLLCFSFSVFHATAFP